MMAVVKKNEEISKCKSDFFKRLIEKISDEIEVKKERSYGIILWIKKIS